MKKLEKILMYVVPLTFLVSTLYYRQQIKSQERNYGRAIQDYLDDIRSEGL
ncbi:hypothetical protein LCGC14_1604070 [marine sediment metagenome]|uniref:Uncharacterized protein n=1 Tax=marine sediment metagenome TaxID=412755 RepID=A0A0F9LAE9_9ZZZZ